MLKTGSGELDITGTSTYTGNTIVNAGTLSIASITDAGYVGPLGRGPIIQLNSTGVLRFTGVNGSTNREIDLSSNGGIDVPAGNTLTLNGNINDPGVKGTLVKYGDGTLILAKYNTYAGGTVLNDGTLVINGDSCLGNNNGSLTMNGGTLRMLDQSIVDASRIINLPSVGTFDTDAGAELMTANVRGTSDSIFEKMGSGWLTLVGENTFGKLVINDGTISVYSDASTGEPLTSPVADAIMLNGGNLNYGYAGVSVFDISSNRGIKLLKDATITFAFTSGVATIGSPISGPGHLTRDGKSTIVLTGNNTFNGITVAQGRVNFHGDNTAGVGSILVQPEAGITNVSIGLGGISSGTLAVTLSNPVTFDNTNGAVSVESNVNDTLTLTGQISGNIFAKGAQSGSGSFDTSGTVILTNPANNWSNTTNILTGTLILGASEVIPNSSAVLLSGPKFNGSQSAGTLALADGVSETVGSIAGTQQGTLVPSIVLGSAAHLISGDDNTSTTFAGLIQGAGQFSKTGDGTLTLTGTNTYIGKTIVSGGTLKVNKDSQAPLLINAAGTDIQTGRVIFDYTGESAPDVRSAIISGQITSTTATDRKGLGYVDDGSSTVTVMYTYFGDANLDGTVGSNDFDALAAHFGETDSKVSWANGDFNYDGTVNALDFNALATNYGQSLSIAAPADSLGALEFGELSRAVPEPSAIALLCMSALGMRRRHRD